MNVGRFASLRRAVDQYEADMRLAGALRREGEAIGARAAAFARLLDAGAIEDLRASIAHHLDEIAGGDVADPAENAAPVPAPRGRRAVPAAKTEHA